MRRFAGSIKLSPDGDRPQLNVSAPTAMACEPRHRFIKIWVRTRDFRTETLSVLKIIGDAGIELGYHLCYGSPADEHCVQPKDAGIMVEMTNAIAAGVKRPIQFFHLPVPKGRTDDAYYVPLETLKLGPETELYLGLALLHGSTAGRSQPLARISVGARGYVGNATLEPRAIGSEDPFLMP
jgi:hypothetical protein